jgi:cytidylate kinase
MTVQDVRQMIEMDVQGMSYAQLIKYAHDHWLIDTDAMTYDEVVEECVAMEMYTYTH